MMLHLYFQFRVYMGVWYTSARLGRVKEDIGYHGAGIPRDCKPPHVSAGE